MFDRFLGRSLAVGFAMMAALGTAGAAQAGLVTLNDTQTQTTDGQNFTFNFNGVPLSDGGSGTFILHARGDYTAQDDETLDWDIEGILSGGPIGDFNSNGSGGDGGPFDFVTLYDQGRNIEWQKTYTVSADDLTDILFDGTVSIFVDLDEEVDDLNNEIEYVEVTFKYNEYDGGPDPTGGPGPHPVPEPSALALFGTGLLAFGIAARRRRKSA